MRVRTDGEARRSGAKAKVIFVMKIMGKQNDNAISVSIVFFLISHCALRNCSVYSFLTFPKTLHFFHKFPTCTASYSLFSKEAVHVGKEESIL